MKETRSVEINGKSYYISAESTDRIVRAKVYDDDKRARNDDALIVKKLFRKYRWLEPLRPGSPEYPSLPEIMQDALTEAVEDVEQEKRRSQQIDEMVENVKETYDD